MSEEIALAFFERLVRLHERMVLGVAYRLLGRIEDAHHIICHMICYCFMDTE